MKTVSQSFTPLVDSLLSIFFPCTCRLCHQLVQESAHSVVCRQCWEQLKEIEEPFCAVCGYPFISRNIPDGSLCGSCRHRLFAFDAARSFSPFTDPLKEIIHQFKYCGHTSLARPLARLLERVCRQFPEPLHADVIIPVPLYRKRERERGFNQAADLA
ncbi:MAG: double zinc ribbon domain-containing protein, partial [Terriglobia bacterium]